MPFKWLLLYSWRFYRFSASIHWLVHGHMTIKLFPAKCHAAGNIAKIVTSKRKQFTVTREMLTAAARHLPLT